MLLENYIIWDPNTELFRLGFLAVRWYSLMIISTFLGGRQLVSYYFHKEGMPEEDVDKFSLQVLIFCLVGARLGEVFFYNPTRYFQNPLEAILPVTFSPSLQFTGYQGLSYHGALIGGIVAVYLYANYAFTFSLVPSRFKLTKAPKKRQSFLWLLTPLAFGVLMGFFVRIGNFINSEIIGTPTHKEYGVVFAHDVVRDLETYFPFVQKVKLLKNKLPTTNQKTQQGYQPIILELAFKRADIDEKAMQHFLTNQLKQHLANSHILSSHIYEPAEQPLSYTLTKNRKQAYVARINTFAIPRHPVQLYESGSYIVTLLGLLYWWNRKRNTLKQGVIPGLAMIISYGFRFFYEFFKDPFNILLEGKYPITTGHVLSLLTVLVGVLIIVYAYVYPDTRPNHKADFKS